MCFFLTVTLAQGLIPSLLHVFYIIIYLWGRNKVYTPVPASCSSVLPQHFAALQCHAERQRPRPRYWNQTDSKLQLNFPLVCKVAGQNIAYHSEAKNWGKFET